MIDVYNLVPSVYPTISRDFQYLSWLINIVLNSVKHNVDDLYDLPKSQNNPQLTELLALTLGFKVKRNYDQAQLAALVSVIPSLLRYKGTKKAIEMAGAALMNAAGSTEMFDCHLEDNCLKVLLPKDLIDTNLFMDLLPYILPAGVTCEVVRKSQAYKEVSTEIEYFDKLQTEKVLDFDATKVTTFDKAVPHGLYKEGVAATELTNFHEDSQDSRGYSANFGLLSNTTIPGFRDNQTTEGES